MLLGIRSKLFKNATDILSKEQLHFLSKEQLEKLRDDIEQILDKIPNSENIELEEIEFADDISSLANLSNSLDKYGLYGASKIIDLLIKDKIKKLRNPERRQAAFLRKKSKANKYKNKRLNDPIRNPKGSRKKFHVFVKDPKSGKIKKIQFGDPNMEIKRDDPERLKSFRARHKCDEAKDKTKAKYWSCYQWRKGKKVDE